MELRHLRYLVAIADAGTFVRAAEQLRVAQPALTRQIHDLEKELGAELFDAKARKATLTPAGEACARLARHVIQDTEQAVSRARLSNSGVAGKCVLLCGPVPLLTGLAGRFIARMKSTFPGISITLGEVFSETQWSAVAEARADIGLGAPPTALYPSLLVETQHVHRVDVVGVAPTHLLAAEKSVTLAALRDTPLLVIEDLSPELASIRQLLVTELKRLRFPASSISPRQFPSFESLIAHVRAGQGWTMLPAGLMDRVTGVKTLQLTDFRAPFRTVRVWRASDTRPVTQTVLSELREFEAEEAGDRRSKQIRSPAQAASDAFVPARLDLRHLRSFVAVARYGSLGRAAEALELTQPGLSRQMRELEYDVGVPLLDRRSRGMDLTVAGEVFAGATRSVLSIVDHVPREIRRAIRGTAQRCVVGAVPHPHMERIIAAVMADLESRHPRVRVGVRSIPSPHQAKALREGDIDVGTGHVYPVPPPSGVPNDLVVVRLFDDRISTALVARDHRLATSATLRASQLADEPFLWGARPFFPRFHDAIFSALNDAGLRPRVDAEYDGLATIWTLAAQGLGWTLGWQSHRDEPPPGCVAIALEDVSLEWGGELVYRQDESRASVLATVDAIVQRARAMFTSVSATEAVLPSSNTSEAVMS
ncbi:MAG TPA: LysR family transcriptional regulator [Gemmatimonadaceae bacterium]|nr:LysR family transcriptional regulator [Gemmatimonadaceae bacterium]